MATPSETPSPRALVREAAGLLLVAAGALLALFALGAMHPLVGAGAALAGTVALNIWAPPKTKLPALVIWGINTAVAGAVIGCAFLYYPPLAWLEIAAAAAAGGVWLASEGA
ncbi:hypothetical protein [Streptomyces boncukensis]|uniref:Uncharacterized protein n=1 Tax=Streptomyces boncukensis TaxID=2711219 RepID=A0A6G4WRE9_9ACTN|nr:hypothetical protein [Streptomyces boncukensis]NGO67071.1 hypothetical protein [Streptomyces boncukensis]